MPERILYLERLHPLALEMAREVLPRGLDLDCLREGTPEEARARLAGVRCAIVATCRVDGPLLESAPSLGFIQHQGVGTDNIEMAALRARGVALALNPVGFEAVAEHTVLLLLAVYRRLTVADGGLRRGEWDRWALRPVSHELPGKTVGLVGFGRNGRGVARRLRGFGCRVVYADVVEAPPPRYGARRVPLEELLRTADVVSLHCPLTPETRGLLGARNLDLLQAGAVIINTARGELVDEAELVQRLSDGRLGGAGLDVFAAEPPPADHPLWRLPNVVVTPHVAAGTRESFQTKMQVAFANIRRYLRGGTPRHLVT